MSRMLLIGGALAFVVLVHVTLLFVALDTVHHTTAGVLGAQVVAGVIDGLVAALVAALRA